MYEVLGYIYASTDHHFIPCINLIKLNDQAVPYYCDDSVTTLMMLMVSFHCWLSSEVRVLCWNVLFLLQVGAEHDLPGQVHEQGGSSQHGQCDSDIDQ